MPTRETPALRSKIMRAVKQKDTRPELIVRRTLHKQGFRFRLHRRDLPGSPDIVLPRHKTAIFVHGCFWHRHEGCRYATQPKTNRDYWVPKFQANVQRDQRKTESLQAAGWRVLTVWECETRDPSKLVERLKHEFDVAPQADERA